MCTPGDKQKLVHRAICAVYGCLFLFACGLPSATYRVTTGTVRATLNVTKATIESGKIVYKVGEYTFAVAMAPLTWPLTRSEIQTIDDLPPKEAIRQGRVKNAPYVVHGKRYVPMSIKEAQGYRERGLASWYGYETLREKGGHMTANGEVFNPEGLTAAHKLLPLPTHVRVTNLNNRRSVIVRVNDRGPFVRERLIDLSAGAARQLGFYKEGTAPVLVQTVAVTD